MLAPPDALCILHLWSFKIMYKQMCRQRKIMLFASIFSYHNCRATKILHQRGETPILDANSGNPFAERPSTARQNMMQRHALDNAIAELDKPVNMPEGVEDHAWERLCKYRKTKIESELLVQYKNKHMHCIPKKKTKLIKLPVSYLLLINISRRRYWINAFYQLIYS